MYGRIYNCNKILEIVPGSKSLSESVKKQLTGEAEFMRAFTYFQLDNLFGDVPLATVTDYRVNNVLFHSPVAQVYTQIIRDLKEAQAALGSAYVNEFGIQVPESVRPNMWLLRQCLHECISTCRIGQMPTAKRQKSSAVQSLILRQILEGSFCL